MKLFFAVVFGLMVALMGGVLGTVVGTVVWLIMTGSNVSVIVGLYWGFPAGVIVALLIYGLILRSSE